MITKLNLDTICMIASVFALVHSVHTTVNREIFVTKIFSDLASVKIKHTKIMCIINDNAVRGHFVRKLFNTKIYCTKYS